MPNRDLAAQVGNDFCDKAFYSFFIPSRQIPHRLPLAYLGSAQIFRHTLRFAQDDSARGRHRTNNISPPNLNQKQKTRCSHEKPLFRENPSPSSPQDLHAPPPERACPQCLLPDPDTGKENADGLPARGAGQRHGHCDRSACCGAYAGRHPADTG